MALNIIPKPNGPVIIQPGAYPLPNPFDVELGSFEAWCLEAFAQRVVAQPRFLGQQVKDGPDDAAADTQDGIPSVRLERVATMPDEAYHLAVNIDGIIIKAASERAVVWALTTLAESMNPGRSFPLFSVEDAPRYRHRGQMLDCARHFFPVAQVKKIIEQLARIKMNVLHWHLSDDQGWRIESRSFPLLHEKCPAYYTQDEIGEVLEYARIRGVEIIPEIDMPGHVLGFLTAYPQYSCRGREVSYATSGGIYSTVLCPGNEDVFSFLEKLLAEVCALFPSPRFHVGGDETPKKEWRACPRCRQRMDAEGLEDWSDLQGYFSLRVAAILKKYGKQALFWNDALKAQNVPGDSPPDMAVQYWIPQYTEAMQRYAAGGGAYVYSNMFQLYFDYPHAMLPLKKVYKSRQRIGCRDCGLDAGLLGIESCMWTEHVADGGRLEALLFPRVLAVAELGWSKEYAYKDFLCRLRPKIDRLMSADVSVTPLEEANPGGKARRKEAIGFMLGMADTMPADVRKESMETASDDLGAGFMRQFVRQFLRLSDLPFLLRALRKSGYLR